jgi:hypothetical protein
MRLPVYVFLFAMQSVFALPTHALSSDSVFTSVDLDHCTSLQEDVDDDPEGNVSMKCSGLKDLPVYFKEGDMRQSTYFGHLTPEIVAFGAETFDRFNHIGNKIEWRLDASGQAYAAILRYFIENENSNGELEEASYGQVLVVSKVGRKSDPVGCVTAYIDARANTDANRLARKLADIGARKFRCGMQVPGFHGRKTDTSSQPYYNFPKIRR